MSRTLTVVFGSGKEFEFTLADNDLAALTEHLDLRNAVHVGHSTGGGEVVRYIARHGDRDRAVGGRGHRDAGCVGFDIAGAEAETGDLISGSDYHSTSLTFHRVTFSSVTLPNAVDLKVTKCDPGVRGDTVSGALKPATLQTGYTLQVPLFINEGDTLKIDTRTGEYLTRV